MGNKDGEHIVEVQKKRRRNLERVFHKDSKHGESDLEQNEAAFPRGNHCREHVEGHGMDM